MKSQIKISQIISRVMQLGVVLYNSQVITINT